MTRPDPLLVRGSIVIIVCVALIMLFESCSRHPHWNIEQAKDGETASRILLLQKGGGGSLHIRSVQIAIDDITLTNKSFIEDILGPNTLLLLDTEIEAGERILEIATTADAYGEGAFSYLNDLTFTSIERRTISVPPDSLVLVECEIHASSTMSGRDTIVQEISISHFSR